MSAPTPEAWARALRIEAQPPYTPDIGTLVEMLNYARLTTLQAVDGLDRNELDVTSPDFPHSISLQLAHLAAAERAYQYISFRGVDPFAEDVPEYAPYLGAMTYGEHGFVLPRQALNKLLRELEEVRQDTLAELKTRDDAWLTERLTLPGFTDMNQHWLWFHVMEEELVQRGQIRLLREAIQRQQQALANE
ncbi:DUF664 domain-containing protein [Deinococcus sp.]|uniref:mycothiol transferase n=1 Tax=Deinococcus sp. TaxID=47478 RepID=UPI003B58F576